MRIWLVPDRTFPNQSNYTAEGKIITLKNGEITEAGHSSASGITRFQPLRAELGKVMIKMLIEHIVPFSAGHDTE